MDATSIITQATADDEQLNVCPNEKGSYYICFTRAGGGYTRAPLDVGIPMANRLNKDANVSWFCGDAGKVVVACFRLKWAGWLGTCTCGGGRGL